MSLETGTYISDLVVTNPTSSDPKSQGDDHIRLLKSTLKTTFPNITGAVTASHTDLTNVAGLSSNAQAQLNLKAPLASPTFTGTVTVPTPSNATDAATKGYADGLAFSTALPTQTGNSGKRVKTNGSSASWDWCGIRLANIAGETMTDTGSHYAIMANAAYTLPDLTSSSSFGLVFPTNASAVPTSVTTSDGWTVTTGAVAGTLKIMESPATATAHGVWVGSTMTPPTLATLSAVSNAVIMGSAQIDTNLVVVLYRTANGTTGTVYAAALNTSTNTWGAAATITTWSQSANAANATIYADSTTTFVCAFDTATPVASITAGSINVGTLAITTGTTQTTSSAQSDAMIKLTNGLYAVALNTAASDLAAVSVSGTTVTIGTAVASGSVTNGAGYRRIAKGTASTFMVAYLATGGGTSATRQATVRVASVSGTTITLQTASGAATNIENNAGMNALVSLSDGASYVLVCQNGTTATTGDFYGATMSGNTATIGTVTSRALDLPASYTATTFIAPAAQPLIKYNASTILFGHLAAGPYAATISGTTLTFGSSGGPATTVNFLQDTTAGTSFFGVGAANFDKLSVSGTTVSSAWQVAATPTVIQSDTLNDKAVSYGSVWYAWTLPTGLQTSITPTKWLYRSGSNLLLSGTIS